MIEYVYLYNKNELYTINAQNRIILSNTITKGDNEVHDRYHYAPRCVAFKVPAGCVAAIRCEVSSHCMRYMC